MAGPSSRSPRAVWLLAACLTGCAASSGQRPVEHAATPITQVPGTLPACASPPTAIARPADFPASFPLPPGAVITEDERRSGGRIILRTVAPSDVRSVALFFERELPAAGYQPGRGESEPGEAEAHFSGPSLLGRWVVREVSGCPGAVTLDVLVGPPGP